MNGGILARTQRVLEVRVIPGGAVAIQRDADAFTTRTELTFDRSTYEAMGSPRQVTVTVEPGDQLNDGRKPLVR